MPADRVCSQCSAWLCCDDDAWCSYCGAPAAQLELELRPSVMQVGQRPPRVSGQITNRSCALLELRHDDSPEWVSLAAEAIPALEPGASFRFWMTADTLNLDTASSGRVRFRSPAGDAVAALMALEPTPQLTITPDHVQAWSGSRIRVNVAEVTVKPLIGEIRLRSAQLLHSNAKVSSPAGPAGILADREHGLKLLIAVEPGTEIEDKSTTLRVEYEGPHGPGYVDLPLRVEVRRRPQLRWAGATSRPEVRRPMARQILRFEFHNQGPDRKDGGGQNADLILQSVKLELMDDGPVTVKPLFELPLAIAGGAAYEAVFEADFSSLQRHGKTQVRFELVVVTNEPTLRLPVTVNLEPIPRFDGVVAIDFGSSNTCCAVWRQGEEPKLVALDPTLSVVTPTVVRYLSLASDPPSIETGIRVRLAAAEDEDVAASVADRLKQRLGDRRQQIDLRPPDAQDWTTREASESAADYLRSLRETAEITQEASFRDFILTHPARCSLRQFERLRWALEQAFGGEGNRIIFMEEPIAALIPFIVQRKESQTYTVASFDLGGGTTDIAIIEVNPHWNDGQLNIAPRILFSRGVRFGGEDLTDFLAAKIAQRCQQVLFEKNMQAVLISENMQSAAALDVYRNRAALRIAAENFKAKISQEGQAQNMPAQIGLRVMMEGGLTATYDFEWVRIESVGTQGLADEFLAHTRAEVRPRAELLRQALVDRNIHLNVIQLSGKTTYLDVVRQTITDMFPGVAIERAPDPKECVVKGACLSRAMRQGRVRLVLPEGTRRMTSTIGIFTPAKPDFRPIFFVDEVIPAGGLERQLEACWDGLEPIQLWEDLENLAAPIEVQDASARLERFGSWEPDAYPVLAPDQLLTVSFKLTGFSIEIKAIGSRGELIAFHSV